MRATRQAQTSIFENYAEHELGQRLEHLSAVLDRHTDLLPVIAQDLIDPTAQPVGRCGLTVENVFSCLLLKQLLQVSYQQLAFHLADSMSYRTFVRLSWDVRPRKSGLQSTIRRIRFTDQRKASKSLAYRIFKAKNAEKERLYPHMLSVVACVLKRVGRGLQQARAAYPPSASTQRWINNVEHYRGLTEKVVEQTERRVMKGGSVPSSEKIVSLFEEHTDIIVKGFRDVHYGHKINVSTGQHGFVTYLSIEDGNPADSEVFLPALNAHQDTLGCVPTAIACDGCYASQHNVVTGRGLGVKKIVFSKRLGLSYHAMGVKRKTYERLCHFRAGVEGNISELKRTFGVGKATWKGEEGFHAFVWSSVMTDNLARLARIESG